MTDISFKDSPSVFDSFNARNLRPDQVAKTFVPSSHYEKLSKNRHSLVLGPRGSGKTTLFKMLDFKAQDAGKRHSNDFIDVNFCAVFIPTDRLWNDQVRMLTSGGFSNDHSRLFTSALFCVHVLHRLAECLKYRCKTSLSGKWKIDVADKEYDIVRAICSSWGIKPPMYSFNALISEIASKKCDISKFIEKEKIIGEDGRENRIAAFDILLLDFLSATEVFIEIVNGYSNQDDQVWALLFDELEISPAFIVKRLMKSMRGGSDKILLKLSLAPYNPDFDLDSNVFSATDGNDFDLITLWSSRKNADAKIFCKKLLESMLRERGVGDINAEHIFGKSELDGYEDILKSIEEEQNDTALIKYINDNSIRHSDLAEISGVDRAKKIRKLLPVLRARYEYLSNDTSKKRSRKSVPTMYSGLNALFDMVEANPRWFIGIFDPLISEYVKTMQSIPRQRQVAEIEKAYLRFISLLKTIPCQIECGSNRVDGVDKALDAIGRFFENEILAEKLNKEPAGSFVVDEDLSPSLKKSLGVALNAGAIVLVDDLPDARILKNIDKKRFRICYLLAPRYHLPLQLMKSTSLKRILDSTSLNGQKTLELW